MKQIIVTFLAAALIHPSAVQAQNGNSNDRSPSAQRAAPGDNDRVGQQATPSRRQPQEQSHRFSRGERFDRNRATNYSRIDYKQNRKLSAPGRNQVWVRSGTDALLVVLSSNIIQRVVTGAF
jgi:Ni/Co efflux regulator RcnB